MPIIPVRNLAAKGILKDPQPYDLEPSSFTGGSNVRFEVGKARRAPVHRTLLAGLSVDPQTVAAYRPSTGFDRLYVGGADGSITKVDNGVATDATPSGRVLATSTQPWTSSFLGDVLYMNRPSHVPAAYLPGGTLFTALTGWDTTWRARSLRAYRDFLVAINVTKGAAVHSSMVKWSDATLAGQTPGSWDETDLSTLAGENILSQLDSPLVDGLALKQTFILYSANQTWAMEFTGDTSDSGQNMFVFRPLFTDAGVINLNCAVEVLGKHFVFGPTDLYVHDGTQRQSIADGRVREWVFRHINVKASDRCFVAHMPRYNEVMFAFVSGDSEAFFTSPTRCNRAAVYNYASDTWSLVDLPNVSAMAYANVDPSLVWNDPAAAQSWDGIGGSWYDIEDGYESNVIFAASTLSGGPATPRLLAYDHMDRGNLPYPYDASCNAPAFLERIGIDMDEAGSDLTTSKVCKRVYPQVVTYRSVPLQIQVGSSMTPAAPVSWGPQVSYDPTTQYKVDLKKGGRYLAIRFTINDPADFEISGFDADIVTGGRR